MRHVATQSPLNVLLLVLCTLRINRRVWFELGPVSGQILSSQRLLSQRARSSCCFDGREVVGQLLVVLCAVGEHWGFEVDGLVLLYQLQLFGV